MEKIKRKQILLQDFKILERETRDKLFKIMRNLQILEAQGLSRQEIDQVIQDMKLPIKFHLYITKNYSDLIELNY